MFKFMFYIGYVDEIVCLVVIVQMVDKVGFYGVVIGEYVLLGSDLMNYFYEGGFLYGDVGCKFYFELLVW